MEHQPGAHAKQEFVEPKFDSQLAEQLQLDRETQISHAYFDFLLQFKSQNWKITLFPEAASLSIGDLDKDEISRIEALTRDDIFMSLPTIPTYTEWAREVVRDFNLRAMRELDRERRIPLRLLINERTAARVSAIDTAVAEMRGLWSQHAQNIDLPRLNFLAFEVARSIYGHRQIADLKKAFSIE